MNQGKYVLSQIMEFIPKFQFNQCIEKYHGNRRVKNFSCYDQLLAMVFGQLSHQESLRGIVICLQSQKEKLYHLGFSDGIFLPTLARANEKRSWEICQELAQILIKQARELYFNDEEFKLDLRGACYVIDGSVIELCLNVFPWAKLKTVRAGVKLNLQMDLRGNIPKFFNIVNAREHDVKFLDKIEIEPGAHYVMDRGYLDFARLYQFHQSEAFFVTRLKKKLKFKRIYSNKITAQDKENGIRCDQVIRLTGRNTKDKYPEKLRRVKFFDKLNLKYYDFVTNDFNLSAQTVANLYKHRWQIELFFKWIKQHLKIKSFWGYSENAVKTQICIAICSYLLVAIAKKRLNIQRNLYEILQILNTTILTRNPLDKLLSEGELQTVEDQFPKQACLWDYLTRH